MPPFPNRVPLPPNQASNPTGIQALLQRFLPSKAANAANAAQLPNMAASTASSGSGLTNTLSNVQQVLKVAQQATPLIKEYGPMVKNAPRLINMMKALGEINDEDEEEAELEETEAEVDKIMITDEDSDEAEIDDIEDVPPRRSRESQPKLFF